MSSLRSNTEAVKLEQTHILHIQTLLKEFESNELKGKSDELKEIIVKFYNKIITSTTIIQSPTLKPKVHYQESKDEDDQDILIDENDSTNNTAIRNVKSPQSINSPQSTTSQQSSLSNTSQQSNKKLIKYPLKSSVMESMDPDFMINGFLTALAEYDFFNKSDEQLHKIKELKFNMPFAEKTYLTLI